MDVFKRPFFLYFELICIAISTMTLSHASFIALQAKKHLIIFNNFILLKIINLF